MRILQICHCYYPPFLDCARQYAVLSKGKPYQVLTVYLTGGPNETVAQQSASDEVIFLGYQSKDVGGLKLDAISKIKAIVQKEQFLFCIAHRVKPTYLALLATNLPVVSVHHNYEDYRRWSRRLLVNFYRKRLLMLGVSDSVRDDLRKDLAGWDPQTIQTLYNRIDVGLTRAMMVDKQSARKALNLPEDAWVVGNVGRLHHDKDQKTLIDGFAKALPQLSPKTLLAILGAGPLEADLKNQVRQLGLQEKVLFLGQVPDAKRYFKAFDLFALTSDREPFGMVLLEAMAADLPIICSDCGGGAEVVGESGTLFKFGDSQSLKEKLLEEYQRKTKDIQHQQSRLFEHFSDAAVQSRFWEIIGGLGWDSLRPTN